MQLSISNIIAQDCNFDTRNKNGHQQVNETLYEFLTKHSTLARFAATCAPNSDTIKVPVVVHLVYGSTTPYKTLANLSDSIVIGLIQDLNIRFTKLSGRTYSNPYSGVNTKIKFYLATRDPQGNIATGITRNIDNNWSVNLTQDNDTTFTRLFGWDSKHYYNLYLVDQLTGLSGYATFPSMHGEKNDGAFFNGNNVWKGYYYNTGLLAHETGHYLGLYHSFTDAGTCTNNNCLQDGDLVCDTPPKNTAGITGSCNTPGNSCTSDTNDTDARNPFRAVRLGGLGDQPDGNENYMDYTGGCWGINYGINNTQTGAFTVGQSDRMRATLLTLRKSLLTSPALVPLNPKEISINKIVSPIDQACSTSTMVTFNVSNLGSTNITAFDYVIKVNGNQVNSNTWNGTLQPNTNTNISVSNVPLTNGSNSIEVICNLTGDEYNTNNQLCNHITLNPSITSTSFVNDFETSITNWGIQNPDELVGFERKNITTCNTKGNYSLGYFAQSTQVAATGTNDYLVSEVIDLTDFNSASFSFDYAHKGYYSNRQLNLSVEISTDCGLNYTSLWKYGTATGLATVASGGVYSAYSPSSCTDWKNISLPLTNYLGQSIKLRFNAQVVSYGAQNLFLDNLKFTGTKKITAVEEFNINKFNISPNPIQNTLTIHSSDNLSVHLTISNITGVTVYEGNVETNKVLDIVPTLSSGVYVAKIKSNLGNQVIKFLK
jgi:hypothetical protein